MDIQLHNKFFEACPLTVVLSFAGSRSGGTRPFTLQLSNDAAMGALVPRCSGVMLGDDLAQLCAGLETLAAGTGQTLRYSTLDPSFLLRGQALRNDDVELIVAIDQGMAQARISTDTGPALLMIVTRDALARVAAQLREVERAG